MDASSDPFNKGKGFPVGNAVIATIITVLGAIVVGALLQLSAIYVTYLIIGSVVIAALLIGVIVMWTVRLFKIRHIGLAVFLAMLGGLLMYGTYRYIEYGTFMHYEREYIYEVEPRMDDARANKLISSWLIEETGYDGPIGFFLWQADQGLEISSTRSTRSSSTTLNKELTLGYWGLEILLALVLPVMMVLERVKHPFCEETGTWMSFNTVNGRIAYNSIASFDEAVSRRDFASIGQLLETSKMWRANLKIDLGRCTEHSPDGIIRVTRLEGRATRVVYEDIITRDEFNTILSNAPQ